MKRRNNAAAAPQTETAAFKKWFGTSKVVDAEGKPLVVYHGTPRGGFSVFKLVYDDRPGAVFFSNKRTVAGDYAGYGQKVDLPGPVPKNLPALKSVTDLRRFVKSPENDFDGWKMRLLESKQVIEEDDSPSYTGMGARVATRYVLWWQKGDRDVDIAEGYQLDVLLFEANAAVKRRLDIAGIYAVYLRMLKPMVVDGKGAPWMSVPYEGGYWKTDQLADIARSKGYDGLILRNIYDNPIQQIEISDVYVVFDPHNIKSATANAGTFDRNDPDIRKNPRVRRRKNSSDDDDADFASYNDLGEDDLGQDDFDARYWNNELQRLCERLDYSLMQSGEDIGRRLDRYGGRGYHDTSPERAALIKREGLGNHPGLTYHGGGGIEGHESPFWMCAWAHPDVAARLLKRGRENGWRDWVEHEVADALSKHLAQRYPNLKAVWFYETKAGGGISKYAGARCSFDLRKVVEWLSANAEDGPYLYNGQDTGWCLSWDGPRIPPKFLRWTRQNPR